MSPSTLGLITSPKTGEQHRIIKNLSKNHLNEIIKLTNNTSDINLRKYTHDWVDGTGRFASKETAQKWLNEKKRYIYLLLDGTNNISGIVWFSLRRLMPLVDFANDGLIEGFNPDSYSITFAIRTYRNARGAGVADTFFSKSLTLYQVAGEYTENSNKGIWLSVDKNNLTAIHLYKKLGFEQVSKNSYKNRLLMAMMV